MNQKEEVLKIEQKYLWLLKGFLLAATFLAAAGILVYRAGDWESARYFTILSAMLACQGVWGFVLFDSLHRRLSK